MRAISCGIILFIVLVNVVGAFYHAYCIKWYIFLPCLISSYPLIENGMGWGASMEMS